jgi:hypothetical protein
LRHPFRRFTRRETGYRLVVLRRRPSLLLIIWLVVGVVVAVTNDYLDSLGTAGRILTALAAILLWPLILIGFDIRITR